jgi:proteic killer suppression protein
MIESWRDADALKLYETGKSKRIPADLRVGTVKKLLILANAKVLSDLLIPPGNMLEALRGDRKGQHSIRINDQFRICFVWKDGNAHNVEVVDYH